MYNVVSFADSRIRRSLERLKCQARSMGVLNQIDIFTESDLPIKFKRRFKDKLLFGSRGFAYWSWKPEVILMSLSKMKLGDCLLYVDAGCHFNIRGQKRLLEYFEILKEQEKGIIAFQANQPNPENSSILYDGRKLFDQPNYRWIKGDLLDYFNVREDPSVINTQAIGATVILIKKNEQAIDIIKEWQQIIWERFDLLDDTPSVSHNLTDFIEHRHDQAIWTLLCLKYGVKTLSAYEYWYPSRDLKKLKPDWDALAECPIHAKRDLDKGLVMNIIGKFSRIISYSLRYFFQGWNRLTSWSRQSR